MIKKKNLLVLSYKGVPLIRSYHDIILYFYICNLQHETFKAHQINSRYVI